MKLIPRTIAKAAPVAKNETAGGMFRLERFLPYRLSVLTNTMSRAFARSYGRRFGLTIPEWRAMAVLGRFEPLSANEVAARTAMDKVRVSRAIARLKAAGLVGRSTDARDRRRSALRLSGAGRQMHDAIVPLARALEMRLVFDLSGPERALLDRLIDKLMGRARAMDTADDPAG